MLQRNFKNYTQIITERKIDTFFSSYTKKKFNPNNSKPKRKAYEFKYRQSFRRA